LFGSAHGGGESGDRGGKSFNTVFVVTGDLNVIRGSAFEVHEAVMVDGDIDLNQRSSGSSNAVVNREEDESAGGILPGEAEHDAVSRASVDKICWSNWRRISHRFRAGL